MKFDDNIKRSNDRNNTQALGATCLDTLHHSNLLHHQLDVEEENRMYEYLILYTTESTFPIFIQPCPATLVTEYRFFLIKNFYDFFLWAPPWTGRWESWFLIFQFRSSAYWEFDSRFDLRSHVWLRNNFWICPITFSSTELGCEWTQDPK